MGFVRGHIKRSLPLPTVFKEKGYRFYFYSDEMSGNKLEPIHIHVRKENKEAKFWVLPISLAYNEGFSRSDLNEIERLIQENLGSIVEKWNDFFKEML